MTVNICAFHPTGMLTQREQMLQCWYSAEKTSCLLLFLSLSLLHSPSSLINEINLYSDSFRLCAALQKGAVSNLIREEEIHVWKKAAGDHVIIFYHEDKSTENAVKHFKAAEMQQIGCVFPPFQISFLVWVKQSIKSRLLK